MISLPWEEVTPGFNNGDINIARAVRAEQRTENGGRKICRRGVINVRRDLQQSMNGGGVLVCRINLNLRQIDIQLL